MEFERQSNTSLIQLNQSNKLNQLKTLQSVAGSRRVSFAERIYDISSSVSTTSEKRRLSCIDLKNSDPGAKLGNNANEYSKVSGLN